MLRKLLVSDIVRRRVHHYHKEAFLATLSHNRNTICDDDTKPTTTTTTTTSRRSYYHTSCKVLLRDDRAYYFTNKTVMIPHDGKRHRGGEDAAAASNEFLIVADGVGGWANEGVNPANFSRTLVQTILDMGSLSSSKTTTTLSTKQNLIELVHTANLKTSSQYLGSATCTVIKLLVPSSSEETDRNYENDDGDDDIITCETLNVGDSGYAIFRKYDKNTNDTDKDTDGNDTDTDSSSCWELLHVSKVGQKEFNFPDQLGGNYFGDDVRQVGISNVHKLKLNDIIVVYTDGVSDNIPPELFPKLFYENDETTTTTTTTTNAQSSTSTTTTSSNQEEVNENGIEIMDLRGIADRIAKIAYVLGKNQKFMSPFAKAAREAGWGKDYIGGKHDDITVMIAQVRSGVKPSKEEVEEGSIFMYVGTSESPSD